MILEALKNLFEEIDNKYSKDENFIFNTSWYKAYITDYFHYIIKNKNCKIFVAGCGYTGLPIAIKISSKKIKTFGFDINLKLINKLKNKYSNRYLTFTNKINYISKADIILIALPTPLTKNYDPDLSYIQSFLNDSKKF